MGDSTTTDQERDLHGDPVTMYPRMKCGDCGEYIYATRPRDTVEGFWKLECECKCVSHDDPEPEAWSHAY